MELQQMRYVLAVAGTGNFTRAARECRVVQSALSHQIAALERELGVRLFARTSRRVALTAAGEAFLPAARACLEAADRAAVDAAAATGEIRGRLAVGMIPTVTGLDLPAVLRDFHTRHPRVRIVLRGGGSDEMVESVRAGELDVALLGLPESVRPRGVRYRALDHDRHVAVLARTHRLATRARLDLAALAGEPFADFPADTAGRAQSDLAFAAAGLSREVAFEAMATDLILGLIRQGLAVALLPSRFVAGLPDVVTVPLADGPTRVEYLAWSDFNPTPAAAAFVEAAAGQSTR
ncbi:LysR family transcriptional regulator [Actinoplanes subtropicus]|uniref:LysR family transcriptional regulator n=1 Tax=Actinoplanes subtropicus TaxID=543632 RepID=UPI0004C42932|nr:LysR family transcriptional regulator [Actinoplanes subtropicus]